MMKINIFWFRRDLRLHDNTALFHALKDAGNVLPIFIFDSDILGQLNNKKDRRVNFIFREVGRLKNELEGLGTSLLVKYGKPIDIFKSLVKDHTIGSVYANHDYEPYAIRRDLEVLDFLKTEGIRFCTSKDHVVFERDEIVKDDGKPYTVYTPYSRKWKQESENRGFAEINTEKYFSRFYKTTSLEMISLQKTGFEEISFTYPPNLIREDIVSNYDQNRNYPGIESTTRLGIHLRFGTISPRQLHSFALKTNAVFLNELIWREFFIQILWHFPEVETNAFKKKYDRIQWLNSEKEFDKWCAGQTGFPIVDAGMRELNETGFMHNRVRMIVASFLTKDLLIDWRWGESYFAEKLLDYELASNNGNWQWAAGTGCDAAPYFRIFNPESQAQKFDPGQVYIKKWVPEINTPDYPKPMIDHAFARKRCLEVYKKAVS